MSKKNRIMLLAGLGMVLSLSQVQAHEGHHDAEEETSGHTELSAADVIAEKAEKKNVQIDMKKLSEAFGNFIGRNLQSPGLKFDMDSLIKGIREGSSGAPSPLTEKEYEEMMLAVQERAFKEMSETNLNSANEFLKKNATATGVVEVVPGKLQYVIVKEGTGAAVVEHNSPKINYTGKYQDGTVFGTSEEMGGPITIPLDQTIPGFSKGILGMKEGEERKLFVHPDLGYGTTGQLPPNELLIFDIKLVKANAQDEKKSASSVGAEGDKAHADADHNDEDFYIEEDEETDEATPKTHASTPATSAPAIKVESKPAK